jgi:hypothetical protein
MKILHDADDEPQSSRLSASKWRMQAIKEGLMPRQPIPLTAVESLMSISRAGEPSRPVTG